MIEGAKPIIQTFKLVSDADCCVSIFALVKLAVNMAVHSQYKNRCIRV